MRKMKALGVVMAAGMALAGQARGQAAAAGEAPCMRVLPQFSAADVPAMAATETAVEPLKAVNTPVPEGLPGNGLAEHPMLYIGEGHNKIFVVNEGKVVWTYSTGPGWEYDDVWMLSNGNVLFTRMQYIAEVTPKKEVVWRYDAPKGTEIHACQPIGLDKVMFVVNGTPPKMMVVNIKTGATEVEHELPFDPKGGVHGQFRRARYTAQGTYLVSFLNMGRVAEYDKDFKEIWSFPDQAIPATQPAGTTRPATGFMLPNGEPFSPWAAIRLKNGNTLITNERGRSQIEVTPDKQIVWQVKPTDLPEQWRYIDTQSCTRLANGNTIICSRGGGGKGPQLVEVTKEKKVVWVLWDWKNLGPASAVQVLDDPGVPEVPGESEH